MPDTAATAARTVMPDRHVAIMAHLLECAGLLPNHAARTAHILAEADIRGTVTHGVRLLPGNVSRIRGGAINRRPNIRETAGFGALAAIDADCAIGMAAGSIGMDRAIELAHRHGIGWVTVRNASHYGASGAYVMDAVRTGLIGVSMSNTLPMMTIEGAADRAIGNNPLAIGAPGPDFPVVLDMATSVASLGRIGMARRAGKPLPPEWLVAEKDAQGRMVLRHFGGAKGSGLAIFTEILTSVMAGGPVLGEVRFDNPKEKNERASFCQIAIRPDALMPRAEYEDGMRRLVAQLKAAEPAEGVDEIRLPGERAARESERRRREGIPLDADTVAALEKVAAELGTTVPWE